MDSGDTCSGGSYNSVCNVKSRSQNFAINIFFLLFCQMVALSHSKDYPVTYQAGTALYPALISGQGYAPVA
jgi:hypothetical protein